MDVLLSNLPEHIAKALIDTPRSVLLPELEQLVQNLPKPQKPPSSTPQEAKTKTSTQNKISAIYVDGGAGKWVQSLGLGNVALGQVTDAQGHPLLEEFAECLDLPMPIEEVMVKGKSLPAIVCDFNDPKAHQQKNNEAELVALMAGLQIAIAQEVPVIYSDSQLVLEYWSQNHVNAKTRASLAERSPSKLKAIEACSRLRNQYTKQGGQLKKVSGKDNPADFGFH